MRGLYCCLGKYFYARATFTDEMLTKDLRLGAVTGWAGSVVTFELTLFGHAPQ